MDIFGPHWENHIGRISASWRDLVGEEDIVLIPGDTSWAMHLSEAADDIAMIAALPGRKVLIRGNHDYWWSSVSRVRDALPDGMYALQNDALLLSGTLLSGTRGWVLPVRDRADAQDIKVYERERIRLELSLTAARRLDASLPITALMHYPPRTYEDPGFSDILARYGVEVCVYGHLHGQGLHGAVDGVVDGIRYCQVSCDGIGFTVRQISPP